MPADKATTPVSTRSISLRPATCIALSFAGNSGAGALVKLTLDTRLGFFAWYASIAPWVNARSPATSTTLMVTGLFGSAGVCANASRQRAAPSNVAAHSVRARRLSVPAAGWIFNETPLLAIDGTHIRGQWLPPSDARPRKRPRIRFLLRRYFDVTSSFA